MAYGLLFAPLMETSNRRPNLEEIFSDAEERFRSGLSTLSDWSEQARSVVQDRPGVLVASLAIAGFMTGLLFRRSASGKLPRGEKEFAADPIVVFLTGAIAGFAIGPRGLEVAAKGRSSEIRSVER